MSYEHVLAIETSCDDTSVAIVRKDGYVVSCLSANQDLAHKPFGGVVPEIASRNHTLQLLPLLEELFSQCDWNWEKVDGVAVTSRPGLIGSLLVGVVTAKTIALGMQKDFIGVNHLEGHILAPFLFDDKMSQPKDWNYPYLALAISGGHTQIYKVLSMGRYEILGRTVDDAAGEAFDKLAKMLHLGFPGGPIVDQRAQKGLVDKYNFPRTMIEKENLNFSFSGLKAAAQRTIGSLQESEITAECDHLCASFQEAVVDTLMYKLDQAAKMTGIKKIVITGGVSANSRLRKVAETWAAKNKIQLIIPPLRYCTDNAAMIGYAGILRLNAGEKSDHTLGPMSQNGENDFIDIVNEKVN
jgi:N6-L-threonylcarbamoyladenine synthase